MYWILRHNSAKELKVNSVACLLHGTGKRKGKMNEKNKRICEIFGIEWHDNLSDHNFYTDAGAVRLLREMAKWEHGRLFFASLIYCPPNIEAQDDDGYIPREYITTPGLLADKLIEWDERRKR